MTPRPWPAPLAETNADPGDVAPPWAEHVQGIAQESGAWFLTQEDRVWRVPMARDLGHVDEDDPEVVTAGIPEPGVDHLGDCDTAGGLVYVAMEGTDPARIGAFDRDLRFLGSAPVAPRGAKSPWCAVSPADGLLYSSAFDTDRLQAYRPIWRAGELALEHAGAVQLRSEDGSPLHLQRVQGGAFSPSGHLFLTSDVRAGGLFGIDLPSGRCRMHVPIPYEPDSPDEDVIEGLTVIDLSAGAAPHMGGVVHTLVLDSHGPRPDYVWLRHFDVSDEADRRLFQPPVASLGATPPARSGPSAPSG